jgi:hypothetical protein
MMWGVAFLFHVFLVKNNACSAGSYQKAGDGFVFDIAHVIGLRVQHCFIHVGGRKGYCIPGGLDFGAAGHCACVGRRDGVATHGGGVSGR